MADHFYQLVLKKQPPHKGEQEKVLAEFIAKEFNLSLQEVLFIFEHPPAVLGHINSRSRGDAIFEHLHEFKVEYLVQTMVRDKRLPFFIEKRQLKLISKEFSKTLRACIETIVFYVNIAPGDGNRFLPSIFAKEEAIEDCFRDSDSIFVINDTSFLLLGFASDRAGAGIVVDKIIKCIKTKVSLSAVIHIGFAIIPEDGKSFYELIRVACSNMRTFGSNKPPLSNRAVAEKSPLVSPEKDSPASDLQIFTLCINKARGKFFDELISLPPEVLWSALSRLPVSGQKKFVFRLPSGSHLIPFLSRKIKAQSSPRDYKTARSKVIKLMNRMELVESLKERNENYKQISAGLNRLESIFAMPSIALQVYRVASDPDSEIEDIVDIVLLDPSLSIKLLKIVNSPFYGLVEKVASIKEAVVMLGREEVVNMAFGLSLSKSFLDSDLKGIIEPQMLWRHSLGTALICRYLSQRAETFNHMSLFTAALIHDLGKVFLVENFPELYIQVIEQARENDLLENSIEEELFGFDHGVIGRRIAENWNLPASLVQAVAFHHRPSSAADHSMVAAIVGFADYLAHRVFEEEEDTSGLVAQLFKIDHTVVLKKIFKGFNNSFIEDAFQESLHIIEENQELFSIAE